MWTLNNDPDDTKNDTKKVYRYLQHRNRLTDTRTDLWSPRRVGQGG